MQGLIIILLIITLITAFINQDVALLLLNISIVLTIIDSIRCFIDYRALKKLLKKIKNEKDF